MCGIFGEKLIGGDFESTDYLCELWSRNILSIAEGDGKGVVEPEAGNETNHVLRIPAGSTSLHSVAYTAFIAAALFTSSAGMNTRAAIAGKKNSGEAL